MKKIICCVLFCCSCALLIAQQQQKAENIVADFGYNLNQWCRTNDISYREKIMEMCVTEGFRVSDQIAVEKALYQGKYQDLNVYLKIFGDIRSVNTQITFSNIRKIKLNNCKTKEDNSLQPVCADIEVKSPYWNYVVSDVFYVKNDKIVYIGDNDGESCQDCACETPFEIDRTKLFLQRKDKNYVTKLYRNEPADIMANITLSSRKPMKDAMIYISIIRPDGSLCYANQKEYTFKRAIPFVKQGTFDYKMTIPVDSSFLTKSGTYKVIFYNENGSLSNTFYVKNNISITPNPVKYPYEGGQQKIRIKSEVDWQVDRSFAGILTNEKGTIVFSTDKSPYSYGCYDIIPLDIEGEKEYIYLNQEGRNGRIDTCYTTRYYYSEEIKVSEGIKVSVSTGSIWRKFHINFSINNLKDSLIKLNIYFFNAELTEQLKAVANRYSTAKGYASIWSDYISVNSSEYKRRDCTLSIPESAIPNDAKVAFIQINDERGGGVAVYAMPFCKGDY